MQVVPECFDYDEIFIDFARCDEPLTAEVKYDDDAQKYYLEIRKKL